MDESLKNTLTGCAICLSTALTVGLVGSIMYCLFHYGLDHKERTVERLERKIQEEALNGNDFALKMHKHLKHYDIKYKNREIVLEALKGNKRALKMLDIPMEEK